MTHTQTQGADGAETKTPKPGDLLYRSEWETKRTITHEDAREIAGRLIASRFRRTDCETARASIPANPDYDDDLLINSYIKQQARKEAAHATSAPAATPGVPYWPGLQLRAALEAAEKCRALFSEIENDYSDPTYECRQGREVADAAIEHLSAAIAAQPAGQAGDAGAGNREHHLEEQLREGLAFIEMEDEAQEPGSDLYTWVKVTEQLLSEKPAPAPSSTRTGAAESQPDELTESEIAGRARKLLADHGWQPGQNLHVHAVTGLMTKLGMGLLKEPPQDRCAHPECGCDADSVCAAALAARPEAPSDAGWRERAATEIDAIAQGWGTEGDADGRAYAKTIAAILRAESPTPPSDPAPSGQAEV